MGTGEGKVTAERRVLLYSPDVVGLGHVRRLMKIARLLAERRPDVAMLLVTGCATTRPLERRPPHVDYVKLPSWKKVGPESFQPRHLPISHKEFLDLRAHLILQTVTTFRPDVVFVDHDPLGRGGELQMALHSLREHLPQSRIVLGLRDILDDAQTVRTVWQQEGVYGVLERYYDLILVYGTPDVFDVVREYAIPAGIAQKLRYCGYLGLDHPPQPADEVRLELGIQGKFVVANAGGGADGYQLLNCFLDALRLLPVPVQSLVVTGPLMPVHEQEKIVGKALSIPHCTTREYVPNLPDVLEAADLVVSMFGYNVATELVALKKPAIVVPRNWPTKEQLLRARAFAERGLIDVILSEPLTPTALADRLQAQLNGSPTTTKPSKPPLDLEGLSRVVDHLIALLDRRADGGARG